MRYPKIKDEVDLKELEKYGYTINYSGAYWYDYYGDIQIVIRKKSKRIEVYICETCIDGTDVEDMMCIFFDLIQAGLVEVVEE